MNCTICGRSTLPGTKLCVQCRKALKRARQVTVSQLEPLSRRAPRPAKIAANDGGDLEARNVGTQQRRRSSPRMGLPASLVALGVVVVTTGYFVSHLRGAVGDEPPARTASPSTGFAPAYVPLPVMPLPRHNAATGNDAVSAPTTAKPAVPRSAKTAPVRPRDPTVMSEPAIARFAAATQADAIAPVPPPPAQPEPVVPDRWQLLSDAIARCASEGPLGELICIQRARWQHCDGYWGKVTQCPGAMNGDFHR